VASSSVQTFADADEYAAAIRQGTAQLTVKQRGVFRAKLTRIDFHRLWMQRFSESLARTTHVDGWGGRAIIVFRTGSGASMVRNGLELDPTSISRPRPGLSYYHHTSGPAPYGGMSLPIGDMAAFAGSVLGREAEPQKDSVTITPPSNALAKLLRLHAAAGELAEDAPAVLAHPEAARGLEQALIDAMMHCLGGRNVEEDRAALRQHAAIMRKFDRVIEQHLDRPLYVTELCKEIGASERTLRACCEEHLGMGPKRYLLLRRMHMVRHALCRGTAADTTVTDTATRYGFWQFGRFAAEYKALFGELPSTTLARPVRH
jgi:AraC-like DNA-binding protein